MTDEYFEARRNMHPAYGNFRTGTRSYRGGVSLRMHDSAFAAKQHLVIVKADRDYLLAVELMYGTEFLDEPCAASWVHRDILELALETFDLSIL